MKTSHRDNLRFALCALFACAVLAMFLIALRL